MSSAGPFSLDRVARLARLEVPDSSREKLQHEMDEILRFIDVLEELDLDDIEPFFGMTPPGSNQEHVAKRDDTVRGSIERDQVLANAADQDGEFYLVPPVFE